MDPDTEAHRNDVTVQSGGTESKSVFLYSVCDKRFTTNRNLSVHMMKHTGGQYSCTEYCGCKLMVKTISPKIRYMPIFVQRFCVVYIIFFQSKESLSVSSEVLLECYSCKIHMV